MPVTPSDLSFQYFDGAFWIVIVPMSGKPVRVTRSATGELTPARIEVRLDNDDNRFDVTDPMSNHYGLLKRYTRCRVRVNDVTRTQAEAASFKVDKTVDHVQGVRGDAWCDVAAEGLLRRILSWSTELLSPMEYAPLALQPRLLGYWPMTDGRDSTALSNALPNGRPGTVAGVTFEGNDGAGGSRPVVELAAATSSMSGQFAAASTTAGWQVSIALQLAALPADGTLRPIVQWWCTNGYRWTFFVNSTTYEWQVIDADGALVNSHNSTFGAGAAPNQWLIHRIKVSQSGGTVTTEPAWYPEGTGVIYGVTDTFSGTVGALQRWRVTGNAHLDGAGMGHLFAVTGVSDDLQSYDITSSFDGYPGETAGRRFERLMSQFGLTSYATGDLDDTQPMGFQRAALFRTQLEEIMRTDDALIFDEKLDATGLRIFTRKARSGQTPALELTYPDDIAPKLDKITDDKGISNYVTASNPNGGEYTAVVETGPLSVAEQPDGMGEKKLKVDVNTAADEQLKGIAEWYRSKGTIDRARYASVRVDVLAHPELEVACEAVDVGHLIVITGLEYDPVPLHVVEIEEITEHVGRIFAFTCEPADAFDVGRYDTAGVKWSSATTVLGGTTYAPSATSLTLVTTDRRDIWSTTAEPYDLRISGEVVTCTAMGSATGSGPYTQTATVTRAVNAVSKTLTAGDEVHLNGAKKWGA